MKSYLPEINRAKRVKGFVIAMRFSDGTEKHIDISQWFKGPVFKALKDPKFFAKFFVEGGTLAWPNGVDIAPEALYDAVDVRSQFKERPKRATRKTRPSSK
ncbi:MAG: DUF2442 domain-containing protein [Pyrinomonadaceae bacterium]|nr:DUF2442 domain-containing protein [Pyrinomonadaceae bacterium]